MITPGSQRVKVLIRNNYYCEFNFYFSLLTEGISTWMRGVVMTSSRALLITVAQVCVIIIIIMSLCARRCMRPLPVPKFKKGLGTSVLIVKITSYQKNNPTTGNIS